MTEQELLTWTANIERKAVNDVKSGYSDPPKHPMCDAVLYIGMRYLYIAYVNDLTTKEEVAREKKSLLTAYRNAAYDQELYRQMAEQRNYMASELLNLEKCGCEHCKKLIRLFDGRDRNVDNV